MQLIKMSLKCVLLVLAVVCLINCENSTTNGTTQHSQETPSFRKSREVGSYLGLITCAMKYDVSCFIDAAEDYLEVRRTELLAEADAEALQSTGRSDPESRPSYLANTLGRLISELTNMFQNGFSGFFKAGREVVDEDDDDVDEESDGNKLTDTTTDNANGEMREISIKKKKKKKPLKSLIRLIKVALVALIIVLKLAILLKILQTAMQFKFLLISLGGFAIQAAKFWMSVKNKNEHGHEEIVYKNPYSSGDEYSSPGGPGGAPYGGEYNAARSAQDLAYSLQRAM